MGRRDRRTRAADRLERASRAGAPRRDSVRGIPLALDRVGAVLLKLRPVPVHRRRDRGDRRRGAARAAQCADRDARALHTRRARALAVGVPALPRHRLRPAPAARDRARGVRRGALPLAPADALLVRCAHVYDRADGEGGEHADRAVDAGEGRGGTQYTATSATRIATSSAAPVRYTTRRSGRNVRPKATYPPTMRRTNTTSRSSSRSATTTPTVRESETPKRCFTRNER